MTESARLAPRLRKALDERREELRWELVPEGGEGEPGSRWATLENVRHRTGVCRHCRGALRGLEATHRIDAGPNRGIRMPLSTSKCDGCGVSMSSNYRSVWT